MSDYKRLTDSETAEMLKNTEGSSWDSNNFEAQCYIRLSELEDKIESGQLVELPCKVGDTIYYIAEYKNGYLMEEDKIDAINLEGDSIEFYPIIFNGFFWQFDFGVKFFTDKAEAEAKLKELQEGKI